MHYPKRIAALVAGLFLFATGTYCTVQACIGLAPWETFSMGLSYRTGLPFGTMVSLVGIAIIALDLLLKEKVGLGTVLDALLIGNFVNLLDALQVVPQMTSLWSGIVTLLLGEVFICLGSWLYMGAGFSCGPRDALMVALLRRVPKLPVGLARGAIEGTALLVGWLLGAPVGVGTVIAVFGIGIILQTTFRLLHFDPAAVEHESLVDTWRNLTKAGSNPA